MRLKMLTSIAWPDRALHPGDIYETDDEAEAGRMIASRFALPVETTAAAPVAETRAKRRMKDKPHG